MDDGDCPLFPNFYEFCISPDGLGIQPPYPRQMGLIMQLLAEYCPRCSFKNAWDIEKIPRKASQKSIKKNITFLEFGRCPKCGMKKHKLVKKGEINMYDEMDLVLGQRSGKSSLLYSMIAPYQLHRWLKLSKPQEIMGMLASTPLVGTFCAQTFDKAQELLFQPFLATIAKSPWFNNYHEILRHHEEKHGQQLHKVGTTAVRYHHRGLLFHPSGPNKKTLRGPTRILTLLDELALLAQGEEKEHLERASANEVYKSLGNSLLTVRTKTRNLVMSGMDSFPGAFACNISSPMSYFDKAMTLVRTYKDSDRVLTAQMPTWEFNPEFTKADFAKEFQDDPTKAERDYGANPPIADRPWLSDIENVLRNLRKSPQKLKYKYAHKESRSGHRTRHAKVTRIGNSSQLKTKSVLGMDAGHAFNSFALTVTAPRISMKEEYDEFEELPFTVNGADTLLVAEIAPEKASSTVVNHTALARDFIYPIIKKYSVGLVVADRWQSIKMLTDIEEEFAETMSLQYTLRGDDFNLVLNYLKDEDCYGVRMPAMEVPYKDLLLMDMSDYPDCFKYKPMSHLVYQFMTANVDAKNVAQKGVDATDDILRALCCSLTFTLSAANIMEYDLLHEPEFVESENRVLFVKKTGEGTATSISTPVVARSVSSNMGAAKTGSAFVARA